MSKQHFTLENIPNQDWGLEASYIQLLQQLFSGSADWNLIKQNPRNTIAYHHDMGIYFKSFTCKPVTEKLKGSFTGGRAKRTLDGTRLLQGAGCMAPQVLATGHYPDNDFVIMEALQGPPLLNSIESYLRDTPGSHWRHDLFRELGLTIGKMHANGVIHGDLRGNNVVIVPDRHHHYRLAMIDNERTRKAIRFKREQLRNLKQIMLFGPNYITSAERGMFFDCYFQAFPHTPRVAKQLAADTLREVSRHFNRKGIVQGTTITGTDYWPILAECKPYEVSRLSNSGEQSLLP